MLSNLMIPAVLFFALGVIARVIKSDLKFPPELAKALSIYLLMSIGLHGGVELAKADLGSAVSAIVWALLLGFGMPVIGYGLLTATRRVGPLDAAAIAAHYGSVSAGTFLAAMAWLDTQGLAYETYPLIMLAVMESPAIVVGLLLAARARQKVRAAAGSNGTATTNGRGEDTTSLRSLLHGAFTNGSVVILVGCMAIGAISLPNAMDKLKPFIDDIFMGALCLFLFEMGMEAARRLQDFKRVGAILAVFGIVMPIVGGAVGALIGSLALDFSVGGATLVAVLAASASYIAVPPAMRLAVPEANPSLYLTLSLGITFPFNVVLGIPLYHAMVTFLAGV
ncbi:sodium-dependent bicarbonate transport family permease [Roseospira navarrensis]|uniref:Sodium-dependent bicarbonate transport family permease n=1 Tax=Roseospira navarrensis TaxID=140058 RepID=A0A7X1ZGV1_9PROT|nr:sodium-dependent bicarbonate transport family permease [Roseospira navarrensis]MQX37366.1 sodium-dependent bicarbonate transport family permease [Roseospira navarrensis]